MTIYAEKHDKICNFGIKSSYMRKLKITVKRMACYEDLMAEYENPIEHACHMRLGQSFIVES